MPVFNIISSGDVDLQSKQRPELFGLELNVSFVQREFEEISVFPLMMCSNIHSQSVVSLHSLGTLRQILYFQPKAKYDAVLVLLQ